MSTKITSLYVCGNSYSAATQATGYQAWPGKLSRRLAFTYIQANNKAQPSAQLLTITSPPRPGLIAQLQSMPTGSKAGALLVIWLFPALDKPLRVAQYLPAYTSGIDIAYQQGFRSVLMPNLPDLTKTIYYQRTYSRKKLRALRKAFTRFNAQYSRMIKNFRRRHRNTKYATVDVFRLWNGTGTVADGLHPNPSTHGLFALWFWNVVK
jgi:hypothetical protein